MLTAIKGIYENGKVILTEYPPLKNRADVIVTFLPDNNEQNSRGKQKIILGMLEGKIDTPDDFNEPLEDLKEYM